MLERKFKHKYWFKNSGITVKEFLDYVLSVSGDFLIKTKSMLRSNNLFDEAEKEYLLSDGKYSYKLNSEECEYLSEHNEYFKSKLA